MTNEELDLACADAIEQDLPYTIYGFHPSTDWNHTAMLIAKAKEWGCNFMLDNVDTNPKWEASFFLDSWIGAFADAAPVAICRAFLLLAQAHKEAANANH